MMFSWYTQDNTTTSVCQVGTQSGVYPISGSGSTAQWKSDEGFSHHVLISGLNPSTDYFFICGDSEGGFSDQYTFSTAPIDNVPFTIGVYGDMGTTNAKDTAKQINDLTKSKTLDWIYHVGDISYANDYPELFEKIWNDWFDMMNPTTVRVPYMVLPGNHEFIADGTPQLWPATIDFKVFNQRFNMPSEPSDGVQNMWYSFDYSYAHFISISTETDYPGAVFGQHFGDQLAWLENDLIEATTAPNRKPFIVVGGHRPMYSSDDVQSNATTGAPINTPDNTALYIQQAFEPLFHKYGVDLFFVGHVHSYERTFPVYQNHVNSTSYVNPQGLVEVVIGCAGSIEGLSKHWNDPQPSWSAYRYDDGYGYGILNFYNATTLSWDFYKSDDNTLLDTFTIVKNAQ
jgi:predicted phosphodiesterase